MDNENKKIVLSENESEPESEEELQNDASEPEGNDELDEGAPEPTVDDENKTIALSENESEPASEEELQNDASEPEGNDELDEGAPEPTVDDENKTMMLSENELLPVSKEELRNDASEPEGNDELDEAPPRPTAVDENKTMMLSENELLPVSKEELRNDASEPEGNDELDEAPPRPTAQKVGSLPPPLPSLKLKGDAASTSAVSTNAVSTKAVSTSAVSTKAVSTSAVSTNAETIAFPVVSAPTQPPTSERKSSTPQIIDNRYEVCSCLGQGAMGAVYEVRHVRLDKKFAMKIIHPQLAKHKSTIARFQREASALSRIDHPNCVGVTDFGQTPNGDFYLVMERVEGPVLSDIVDHGALSIKEAIEITKQLLMGLGHAHKAGILHRDIKMENLIQTTNEDGGFTIKILDFGLAKEKNPGDNHSAITEAGIVLGTPQYIAPETILTQTMNQQTDLYAVGVTFFRMLTGQPLWTGEDIGEILQDKVRNPTPKLNDAGCGEFPKSIEDFLVKALDEPQRRFADVTEMLDALEKLTEDVLRPKARISVIAQEKIKPVTAAAVKYSLKATVFAFERGKFLSAKIGTDVQTWLSRLPSGSEHPLFVRMANFGKMIAAKVSSIPLLKGKTTPSEKPEGPEEKSE